MDCRQMNRHCAEITKLAFALPSKAVTGIEAAFRLAVDVLVLRRCTDFFVEVHPIRPGSTGGASIFGHSAMRP
jgi:hypothetical protein